MIFFFFPFGILCDRSLEGSLFQHATKNTMGKHQAAAHLKAQLSGDEERSDPTTWSTKVFRGHVRGLDENPKNLVYFAVYIYGIILPSI